ncbi:MAG TPA: MFS transporter [Candidatus Dormibacteraeota bacterium]|nr:MFS transporter [Candidatus Dormibacteraeota bacterium]
MTTITEDTKTTAAPEPEIALRARNRIASRLLPFLFLLYVIAFLDRMNIGAAALQMPQDLGFSERVIGMGAGVFFLGYFLLEIPGALIAERWSARRWIARIMISWGLVTVLMAFIHTSRQFYVVRFLVGAAEAGFFPGVIVYLTHWFRYGDRAKAVAFFYAANPLSYVIGSPLAGLLLGLSWLGMRGWRWLFIIEGIPAVVLGLITIWYLTDWPHQAKWLPADEKSWITTELQNEKEAKNRRHSYRVWEALRHRDVILLTVCYFCAMTGSYGIAFWLPTILKRLSGKSDLKVTLLAALPYIAAFLTQQVNGWHSDRTRERRWHAAIPVFVCGLALACAVLFRSNLVMSVGLFVVAGGAFYGFQPVFWTVPTLFLSESAAAASIGLINAVGNLGGFVGPYVIGYLVNRTHSFSPGLLYLVASLFLSGSLMLAVGRQAPVPQVSSSY